MSKIHKLKPPKSKSENDVIGILTDALHEARNNKVLSVSISMVTKKYTYTTFCVTKDGTFTEALGANKIMEHKLLKRWEAL